MKTGDALDGHIGCTGDESRAEVVKAGGGCCDENQLSLSTSI